jgi:hypothetical protein
MQPNIRGITVITLTVLSLLGFWILSPVNK